jgi:hypothetical protein
MDALTVPKLAVSSEEEAISKINSWLHREIGMALHATTAQFNRVTFCWHLPIELAYPAKGKLGVIGDIYLHAATGEFVGLPEADDLRERAENLAKSFGIK